MRPMRSSRSGDLASAALPRRCRLAGPRRCRRLFLVGARRGSARLERGELKEAHQRRRRGRESCINKIRKNYENLLNISVYPMVILFPNATQPPKQRQREAKKTFVCVCVSYI